MHYCLNQISSKPLILMSHAYCHKQKKYMTYELHNYIADDRLDNTSFNEHMFHFQQGTKKAQVARDRLIEERQNICLCSRQKYRFMEIELQIHKRIG